jgi:hypothetical protein
MSAYRIKKRSFLMRYRRISLCRVPDFIFVELTNSADQIRPIFRPAICARSRRLPELRDSILLRFFLDVSISDQEAQFSNEISQNLLVSCHQTLFSTGASRLVFGVCNATINSTLNPLTAQIG